MKKSVLSVSFAEEALTFRERPFSGSSFRASSDEGQKSVTLFSKFLQDRARARSAMEERLYARLLSPLPSARNNAEFTSTITGLGGRSAINGDPSFRNRSGERFQTPRDSKENSSGETEGRRIARIL